MRFRPLFVAALAVGALVSCSEDSMGPGQGRISLRMTDAPFPLDQVESINVFVVRVEAKTEVTTEEDVALDVEDNDADGWVVLATPNESFDLMDLRNGVSVFLGDALIPEGNYHSVRLILDTDKSSVTLKNGMILTGASNPSIKFPSAGKSGIKVIFSNAIEVDEGETTDVLLDFDAEQSFVLRGSTIEQNGLLFKPVIKASVQE